MNTELFRETFHNAELSQSPEEHITMLALAYLCKPGETSCTASHKQIAATMRSIGNAAQKMLESGAGLEALIDELQRLRVIERDEVNPRGPRHHKPKRRK